MKHRKKHTHAILVLIVVFLTTLAFLSASPSFSKDSEQLTTPPLQYNQDRLFDQTTQPWWGTTLFRGFVLLLFVGLAYIIYRRWVRSILARNRELEKEVTTKTKDLQVVNKRLQEEIIEREATEARLHSLRDELATVLAVSNEIVSTLDLKPLLILILDQLRKVVDYDVGTIRRLIQGNMELQAHRWLFPQAGQPSQRLPVATIPIIREMVQTRGTILKDDHQFDPTIVGDPEYLREELTGEVLQASRSLMCVPLMVKSEVIGMLVLGHHKPNYWGEETKELVQAFANQAAVAIINAELFEKAGETAMLEERTRLARELHDSATQSLYSAGYYLSRVSEVIHQALKDMRLLVFQMRPPVLEKGGLVGAIRQRLDAVEKRAGMEVRLVGDPLLSLPGEVSEELYSIALEALNNVLKHAETDSVTVSIHSGGEILTLEVDDDGRGFDLESVRDGGGLGLGSMQERALRLGGDLTIESTEDQGTSVKVTVQLNQDTAE